MARTRKQITMLITVSMPLAITAAQARREVKSRVKDLCEYCEETGTYEVKFIAVKPAKTR